MHALHYTPPIQEKQYTHTIYLFIVIWICVADDQIRVHSVDAYICYIASTAFVPVH